MATRRMAPVLACSLLLALGCGDDADRPCVERQGLLRLSPVPPGVQNELLRTVCEERQVDADGCDVSRFRFSGQDPSGFIEAALASVDGSCPAFFRGEFIESALTFTIEGSQVVMTRSGTLLAQGEYSSSDGTRGQIAISIEPAFSP